ncbi:DUF4919 domain-containing protein [Algoriphagus confluentis]|uniref:DUF4919 domain-containing protein n=1 Tax=Algoriphagus confluentis TaxID=1697556 RepID=A0ABQ6PSB2_9BACT|nr:hypothetical protein Aconfl_27110 [Algoriphagus confluentis]
MNVTRALVCVPCLWIGISFSITAQNFNYQQDFEDFLARAQNPNNEYFYSTLLARFNQGDTTLNGREILHLLIGFTSEEEFKPYEYFQKEREIFNWVEENEYLKALESADSLLAKVPVSQQTILSRAAALYYLERPEESGLEIWKFQKIMEAMAWSGDGTSPETAFFALGPADGQNFIQLFLGQSIGTMGSGSDQFGNFVDILEMVFIDEKGEQQAVPVYFQIEHASKTLEKMLKSTEN